MSQRICGVYGVYGHLWDCYLEHRSPWHKGWGCRLACLNYIHTRNRRCACAKTYRIWDHFAFLLASCSVFSPVLLKPGLLTWENVLVCGLSLSPSGQHVWKRGRSRNMWQLDTSIVLMWMCVLVILNSRNIRNLAPFLLVSTVLAMLGKKEEMIPLAEAVPGTETGRGSSQAPWPARQCCRDAWQVKLQAGCHAVAMAWVGCWLAQDGQGTEQSGSEQLYLEQHLFLIPCGFLQPVLSRRSTGLCNVEDIPLSSMSILWAELKYFNITYFLPPLQNTVAQQRIISVLHTGFLK